VISTTTSLQIALPPYHLGRKLRCTESAVMQQQDDTLHVDRLTGQDGAPGHGSPINAGLVAALILPLLVLQLRQAQPPGRAVRAPRHARLQALAGAQAEVGSRGDATVPSL
jgi:hypothetical protein